MNKIVETTIADIDFFYFLVLFSKKNHGFIEEDNPSEKVVTVEEKLNVVDMDDIGDFGGLRRLVFIDKECGKHRVVDVIEILPEMLTKRMACFIIACGSSLCDKCCRRQYLFNNHVEYGYSVR